QITPSPPAPPAFPTRRSSDLIVDDSPVILAASRHALTEAGYDVDTRDGVDELGAKGTDGFDLILMDVQMPELHGDDIAAVLRTKDRKSTRLNSSHQIISYAVL